MTLTKIAAPFYYVSSIYLNIRQLTISTSMHMHHVPNSSLSQCTDYNKNYDHEIVKTTHQHVYDTASLYNFLILSSTEKFHLKQIHSQLLVSGFYTKELLVSKFIVALSKIGDYLYARKVFDESPHPNVFMWNAIIGCYSKCNMFVEAVEMYVRMQRTGVSPDCYTLSKVLKGCSCVPLLEMGTAVHGQIFRVGFGIDIFVQNALVAFYAKCGSVDHAKMVFDGLCCKTVVSWTALVSGCAQNGQAMEALGYFSEMKTMNMKPDWITLVSVLRACADLEYLEQGKSLHGCVIKMGFELKEDLRISLTAMYAKCGQVTVARYLFDQMAKPNLILWNAMISGYAKNGYAEEAVALFQNLVGMNVKPDSITVRAAILACSQVGSLDLARWINDYVIRSDYQNHTFVKTAVIDMYAKCGRVDLARNVFDGILDKDVVAWSAMIVGYGLHGHGKEAINLYNAMLQAGVWPNDVTFLGLLTACKNSGLVQEGWDFFHSMKDYGIDPLHQHYACVVDLLGRAGYLGEAYKFIVQMPIQPGLTVWGALLSACKIHRHVRMGEYAAAQVFSIDPYDTGHYVQLSNLYAVTRMWNHVHQVRKLMKERGLSKEFGYSSIEIEGKLHLFRMGDNSHPRSKEIWQELDRLERKLKDVGYIPDTESSLHDLNSEEMQESLCGHSERLAIAYGLIATPSGSTLRITKNLRACVNCHSAIKLISRITNREIIVRDVNRFHHFKDGVCSCGDYW